MSPTAVSESERPTAVPAHHAQGSDVVRSRNMLAIGGITLVRGGALVLATRFEEPVPR